MTAWFPEVSRRFPELPCRGFQVSAVSPLYRGEPETGNRRDAARGKPKQALVPYLASARLWKLTTRTRNELMKGNT